MLIQNYKAVFRNTKSTFDQWSKLDFRVFFTKNPILQQAYLKKHFYEFWIESWIFKKFFRQFENF